MTWMVRVWYGANWDQVSKHYGLANGACINDEFHFKTEEEAHLFKDRYNKKYPLESGWQPNGKYGPEMIEGSPAMGPWLIEPPTSEVDSALEQTIKTRREWEIGCIDGGGGEQGDCYEDNCIYCKQEYRMECLHLWVKEASQ